jgi:predicted ATP-dependent endonuclease of OLD family
MINIEKFNIKNFKGVKDTTIELSKRKNTPVITLIGLNESGKTTILEGLSKFVTADNETSDLFNVDENIDSTISFIPKSQEAAFTDKTSIKAYLNVDKDDLVEIQNEIEEEHSVELDISNTKNDITAEARFTFQDSVVVETRNYYSNVNIKIRHPETKEFIPYVRPDNSSSETDIWSLFVNRIAARLPKIRYFPTFLVDIPDKIYIEEHSEEEAINRYYRKILQDVLSSVDPALSLDKHVIERLKTFRTENPIDKWYSEFMGHPKKKPVDAVFNKISNAISREILGNWEKVFQRSTSAKIINVEFSTDASKNYLPYVSFNISDGDSSFSLHERSLGFRWFFTFLLFTRFTQGDSRKTLFLFDEPAANLHAKAQSELLESYNKILEDGNSIIYSTHSHHMIEPKWLSGAYIVENLAIRLDDSDSDYFSTKDTDIKAISYRNFVSQSSERVSYYLPILEKLKYEVPKIAENKSLVVLEGVSDYHLFSYVKNLENITGFELVPGESASNMGPLLSYLIGLGSKFLVVLDDDKQGRTERDRYQKDWILSDNNVVTLESFDKVFNGKKLETLISEDTKKIILGENPKNSSQNKKKLGLYFAECNFVGGRNKISKETRQSIRKILLEMKERLK